VAEKYQIVDKMQFNTDITEVRWLEDEQLWEAKLLHMVPGTGDLSQRDRQKMIEKKGRESVYLKEEMVRAKIVCSCAGGFVEPHAWPDNIPGKDQFKGDIFHSARWDCNVNLQDKNVVVVGTGCSAAQFVPQLTKEPYNAKSVIQIMRSPPWVVPRPIPPFGHKSWEKYSPWLFSNVPGLGRLMRTLAFLATEKDFHDYFLGTPRAIKGREAREKDLIKHLKEHVPEKYHEILTPDYSVGCKRQIYDASWFPGLNDPKINLTTQPLTSLQPHGVTIGPGRSYPDPQDSTSKAPTDEVKLPADTIILGRSFSEPSLPCLRKRICIETSTASLLAGMSHSSFSCSRKAMLTPPFMTANGFETTNWLSPLKVIGKDGHAMHDVWKARGGAQAYMGNAMDGFPNFFIIFGPNTATGHSSVILATENMVEYTIKFIRQILNGDVRTFDVKKEKEEAWTRDIQEKLKGTVWMSGGCSSWYKTADGWNATAYP